VNASGNPSTESTIVTELAKVSRAYRLAGIGFVLLAIYTLGILNYWFPAVRWTAPLANTLTFAALQLIPFTLLAIALVTGPSWARVMCCVVLLPVAALAALLGSCAALESAWIVADGFDAGFEQREVVSLSAGHLGIYRTNGGATTSFGIAVRQECRLAPGLMRVRNIWGSYPAYEVRTQVLAPDRVRFSSPPYVSAPPYGDRPSAWVVQEVGLEPLWCPLGD